LSNGNGHISKYAAAIQTADWSAAEVRLIKWCQTEPAYLYPSFQGTDAFAGLLATIPKAEKPAGLRLPTVEENISLIASRLQYINELKSERERESDSFKLNLHSARSTDSLPHANNGRNQSEWQKPFGLPLACASEKGEKLGYKG